MSPFLRRVGFILSFVIVAMALHAQLTARPTLQLATQVSKSQAVSEKPARARIGRVTQLRNTPRPVTSALA
ncbi:hypothetical protein QO058_01105 [Bosea vestrisii]|uniref:hypothetical protein n=1 Tax=Bosea vestrisii TaxID=151416 RepID=UPI0024E01C1C|nr:hypothetical protein [Bosea vestrisii]WID96919.1 hypothetical protein QO058_01105 [Bosea vestrisii]